VEAEAEASAALTTQNEAGLADFSLVHPRSAALASPLQSPDSAQHPGFSSNLVMQPQLVQSGQSVQSTPHLLFNAEDEPRASPSLSSTYGLATFSYS
jgi:hypothetical protein